MKKFAAGLILICLAMPSQGAFEDKKPGARRSALGDAYVALADDALAIQSNPGGLGFIRTAELSLTHTELFSIDDLAYEWAGFTVPLTSILTLGGMFGQFGPAIYRETESAIAAGIKISDSSSCGVSVSRLDLDIGGYGSSYDWAVSVGFLAHVTEWLRAGMAGKNIFSTRLGSTDQYPEKSLWLGLGFIPRRSLKMVIECGQEKNARQITYRLGEEISIGNLLDVRFGFHNYPDRLSAGFGIAWGHIRIDYALITHPRLSLQHQFSVVVRGK